MIGFLKYINDFPFPITAKHYSPLGPIAKSLKDGELHSKESWQVMRDVHPDYKIAKTREEWLEDLSLKKDGQDNKLMERVLAMSQLIKKENIKTFLSIGSGGGVFEYYLKKQNPDLKIFVSEPTIEGKERLKNVFLEADYVEVFDALNVNDWKKIGGNDSSLVFIYRNEREFSNEDWRKIFDNMYKSDVRKVFLGLMSLATIYSILKERIRNLKLRFKKTPPIFVGFMRNYATFESFWYKMYNSERVYFSNCVGIYLKINK